MKVRSILIGVVACLTAGLMAAQDAPPARHGFGPGGPRKGGPGGGPMSERWLSKNLALSAEQSNKIHSIFQEAHVAQQGTLDKMSTLHTSLATAVKNGDEASIESVTREMGNLHQQQIASHAKVMAKVYATLTADQKAKVAPELDHMFGGMGPGPRRQPPAAVKQ
jgi:Spy/CpxP family protein refolding chaperone